VPAVVVLWRGRVATDVGQSSRGWQNATAVIIEKVETCWEAENTQKGKKHNKSIIRLLYMRVSKDRAETTSM